MAKELFYDNPIGHKIRYLIAINLPGRGYSSLPKGEEGLLFGDMTLSDHAQIVIGTLEQIQRAGFHPSAIMAHSQGGLIVQMVQQELINAESSLRARFGIKKVFMMASISPSPVPWNFGDLGYAEEALGHYINTNEPMLGAHIAIPDMDWVNLFFVNPADGSVPATAPSVEKVITEEYNSPESLIASQQLVSARPAIDPGIFNKTGTKLTCIAMGYDIFFQSEGEQEALYEYLTNDSNLKRFAVVDSPDSVHSMYISNPRELLDSLIRSNIHFP